jgi:hypothetical protein
VTEAAIQVPTSTTEEELQALIERLHSMVAEDPLWKGYVFSVFSGEDLAFALPEKDYRTGKANALITVLLDVFSQRSSITLH